MGIVIDNAFEVPEPLDRVWAYLLDVERIAPCLPGAEITETIDDSNYGGIVRIKLGPVSLTFHGEVTIEERDDEAHRVVLKATGSEQRGKGAATAIVTARAVASDAGTAVSFTQDISITGSIAQYSGGMIQDVSARLTRQFADCLRQRIGSGSDAVGDAGSPRSLTAKAAPISGIRMGLWAFWRSMTRVFRRIFGARRRP